MGHSRSERRPFLVAEFVPQCRVLPRLRNEPDRSGNYKGFSKDPPRGQRTVPGPGRTNVPDVVRGFSPDRAEDARLHRHLVQEHERHDPEGSHYRIREQDGQPVMRQA